MLNALSETLDDPLTLTLGLSPSVAVTIITRVNGTWYSDIVTLWEEASKTGLNSLRVTVIIMVAWLNPGGTRLSEACTRNCHKNIIGRDNVAADDGEECICLMKVTVTCQLVFVK